MKNTIRTITMFLAACFVAGCATKAGKEPINYLSINRPTGVIHAPQHAEIEKGFPRGGWYFGNHNFRPAPDVGEYVKQTAAEANSEILRKVDVRLGVPFAFDILFFGYNGTTDQVLAKGR